MGYDVYVEGATGAPPNHTSNTSEIMRHCLGFKFRRLDGLRSTTVEPILLSAIGNLLENQAALRELEPENKWGTVESTLDFFRKIKDQCAESNAHGGGAVKVTT